MKYPVITLHQPWAQFIALGWKTIETRLHTRFDCLLGKRILIHAGAKWDLNWPITAGPYMTPKQFFLASSWKILDPQIVCSAFVGAHGGLFEADSSKALINCGPSYPDRFGLHLEMIKLPDNPILVKGKQGIWYFKTNEKFHDLHISILN